MRFPTFPPTDATAPVGVFLLRVSLGVMATSHGLSKIFDFTVPGTVAFFENVGFPGWFAYPTMFAEVVGGILLIVGVMPRLVALILVPVLFGALTVHAGNGWSFTNQGGGWEYPAFLLVAAIIQILIGDGPYALVHTPDKPRAYRPPADRTPPPANQP